MCTREAEGLSSSQCVAKRALDLAVSVPLLVVTAPVQALAVLVARRSTGGSGLYRQRRVGRCGEPFVMHKVRTMRCSPDPDSTTVTTHRDARVTPAGAFMRRWKIDELPQLYDVVRGRMSLVGPRPDVPGYADVLSGEDRLVLSVRPGITGPATLHYRAEERLLAAVTDPETHNRVVLWPHKVAMNVEYVRGWTLRRDLKYLVDTLRRSNDG